MLETNKKPHSPNTMEYKADKEEFKFDDISYAKISEKCVNKKKDREYDFKL